MSALNCPMWLAPSPARQGCKQPAYPPFALAPLPHRCTLLFLAEDDNHHSTLWGVSRMLQYNIMPILVFWCAFVAIMAQIIVPIMYLEWRWFCTCDDNFKHILQLQTIASYNSENCISSVNKHGLVGIFALSITVKWKQILSDQVNAF